MPVVSSQSHSLVDRSVQVISESGVLNPDPKAASNFRYGQLVFCEAGIGSVPLAQTPSMNPDRSVDAVDAA